MVLKLIFNLTAIFLCSTSVLLCQNSAFGVTGNIGLSKIADNSETSINRKDNSVLSGNAGLFFEKRIKSKSSFGLKLLWILLEGKTDINNIPLFTIIPETLMEQQIGCMKKNLHL